MANLARWTGDAGDPAGARDQAAALLPINERVLGPEHRDTLTARHNLAQWTGQAGDPAAARDQLAHHGRAAQRRMYSFTRITDPQGLARVADAWPRDAAIGRLGQVCDRWIYSACLCFGLDLAEQERSGFRYAYSVYQAEYSRNLLFRSGAQMEKLFDRILDRTRSRLDIPALRTLFGLKTRPHHNRTHGPPAQEIVIEKPQYGLAWFRIRFGRLQLKAYTKGEHVLRFEATVHNTKELRCRRAGPPGST